LYLRHRWKRAISYLHDRQQKVEIKWPHSNYSIHFRWGIIKCGIPHGSVLGPLPFLKELPQFINSKPKYILMADDASYYHVTFRNWTFSKFPKWCFHYLKQRVYSQQIYSFHKHSKNSALITTDTDLKIRYENKKPAEAITFLHLQTDSNFNYKTPIKFIIPKPSSAHFAIKTFTSLVKKQRMYDYFTSHTPIPLSYGIIRQKFNRDQNGTSDLNKND
jgi:hypothetical protein